MRDLRLVGSETSFGLRGSLGVALTFSGLGINCPEI